MHVNRQRAEQARRALWDGRIVIVGGRSGAGNGTLTTGADAVLTAPYFHHGIAQTLDEVLNGTHDQNGTSPLKGIHHVTDPTQRANLLAFLRAIDDATPTLP